MTGICNNTIGSFTCEYAIGYEGDGFTCVNIDECAVDTEGCHAERFCTDNDRSSECDSDVGYEGDGFNCTNIHECDIETDDCHDNPNCTDTIGSFDCDCNTGISRMWRIWKSQDCRKSR